MLAHKADTHASFVFDAANLQPSTTVNDSRLVASRAVGEANTEVTSTSVSTADSGADILSLTDKVHVELRLPKVLLDELAPLSLQPRRLPVIADGRCSVASVLLARDIIPDDHITDVGRHIIDAERRRLGSVMVDKWGEKEWIRQVPIHVRGAHMPFINTRDKADNRRHRSFTLFHQLIAKKKPTEWLDHAIFYLASAEYEVGIFVLYQEDNGQWYCVQIGDMAGRYIVLYQACGHYETVEYGGQRIFSSGNEFVARMSELAARFPQRPHEEDIELLQLEAQDKALAGTGAVGSTASPEDSALSTPSPKSTRRHVTSRLTNRRAAAKRSRARAQSSIDLTNTPVPPCSQSDTPAISALSGDRVNTLSFEHTTCRPKRRSTSRVRRRLHVDDSGAGTTAVSDPKPADGLCTGGTKDLPPLVAQVAEHGSLYERVSFHNQAHWRAANEPLWNAYRLASMTGQRNQLTAILLDILLLPQRVLPKMGRSGKAARRRAVACTSRRLRSEAERLRDRYNTADSGSRELQQAQMSTETMANTSASHGHARPQRAASAAAREAMRRQASNNDAASSSEPDEEAEGAASGIEDERDGSFHSLGGRSGGHLSNPDAKAARRANYLVQCGLTRKAAQVLHSTTNMADLRTVEVQQSMLRLHPQPSVDSVLPVLPQGAPPSVLEDDTDMRRLLTQSDNGTAAGPSGWGGNMLSILVQSEICRLGVVALLRDIINGELSDDARKLLLTSRLVALAKPDSDSYRPIAVGELFYRLAAIVVVRRVSSEAAVLLSPHQYGVGVAAGAEKIVHSLQHELADEDKRLALLQLDMANAFNSCDRARLLRELYTLPELQSAYRVANFAYSQPSPLVLSGCDGFMIESAQGVRQGDPLSALLFCVYMKQILQQVSDQTGVRVYGFFDDVNLLGSPQQLMAALNHLQSALPQVSLQLNTAKSHFAYFHDHLTPLSATVRGTLTAHNIEYHHQWVGVVGAVVGRDDTAIREGMGSVLTRAGGHDAFLRRIRLDELPIQTAMLLLRQCLVPALNYHLRCIAPVCIEDEARMFDQQMVEAAADKLGLDREERTERTTTLLQRRLRDGGWGLTSAAHTSVAAFLGSLAACCTEPVFSSYSGDTPVPHASQLHAWLEGSLRRVRQAAPGDKYRMDIEPLLPVTAATFFSFHATADTSTTAKLQHTLNAKATQHSLEAAVQRMKEESRRGDKRWWAHHKATTAKGAWTWRATQPESAQQRLSDVEYALAARLSLDLRPFPAHVAETLPEHCPMCRHGMTGELVSLRDEPWHWLVCTSMKNGELRRRHDAVVDVIARVAGQVGAQVMKEVEGLDPDSKQRPDLQLVFPGRMLLSDVSVSHSLTVYLIARGSSSASSWQSRKNTKYAPVAARLGAELLNVCADASGGMATGAFELARAIGDEGERWLGAWSSVGIQRYLLECIAAAIQRGNAMVMLTGFSRAAGATWGSKEQWSRRTAVAGHMCA